MESKYNLIFSINLFLYNYYSWNIDIKIIFLGETIYLSMKKAYVKPRAETLWICELVVRRLEMIFSICWSGSHDTSS